jgi:ABC transport system ATP-binding/permease protein
MDEKQQATYSEVIQALIDCPRGEEASVYEKYSHLVDENLLEKIAEVADLWEREGSYAPRLRQLAEILSAKMGASAQELNQRINGEFLNAIQTSKKMGFSLQETKKLLHGEEIEQVIQQIFPFPNSDLVTSLNKLTSIYQSQGRLAEAKPYYDEAFKIWRELYGDSPNNDVATTLNNLGELHASQGENTNAKDYYKQALKIWRELYGDSPNNDVATTLNNLGELYASQRENTTAKDYYEQALKTWRELYQARPNNGIATSLNNLGELYASQKRWLDAKPLYEKALAIRQELYGDSPNHDLATSYHNLGEYYAAQEQWAEAEPLYKKALEIRRKLSGDNPNKDLATSHNKLGEYYAAQNEWASAILLYKEALEIWRKLYGDNPNHDLATTLNNLAVVYRSQERLTEAEPLYNEALAIRRKLYGYNPNDDLATSLNNLAILYSLQGRATEAKPLYEEALKIRQKLYGNLPNNEPVASVSNLAELCQSQEITLGRDPSATLQLDAPTVDRIQATITQDSSGSYILKDRSTNGVFVNGQRVDDTQIVSDGATIKINPFTLTLKGDELQLIDSGDRIRLDVDRLTLRTKGKYRLQQLSFAIEPGQFVALVGGSGAGKSTLMRTLLGIESPTSGAVYINGDNLRQNFDLYRNQIGYVPQDDIIHMDLSVEEVLTYAAKLRLPPDINLRQIVNQALNDIKMTERRKALIKDLSGGQRKRVSIGVELLANPKLFFLDEPTSGLDPGLDKQMMELLRDLAHNDDRTIVLVTHATANITDCDRVVFLGSGGKLCYFGTPAEALTFFKVSDFANIYIKLQQESEVDRYVELYQNSSYFQKYIANNLRPNSNSKKAQISSSAKKANSISQWKTLTHRYFMLISRDRANLRLALLTAPVGIILMYFAVRDRDPFILGSKAEPGLPGLALQVLFVFTCASLWVGLSSSLQEIVKESAIYSRERLVNLRLRSYLGSKVAVLATLAVVQTILIAIFITIGFKSPTFNLIPWQIGIFINTFLTLTASFSLGLLVSTAVKNSTRATSALPLLLLPQIIFSGVLFKLQDVTAALSYLMLSRWAIGAYGTIVNINQLLPKNMKTSLIKDMPFPTGIAYEPTWSNLSFNWLMLIAHIIVYLTVTAWLQKKKDIL